MVQKTLKYQLVLRGISGFCLVAAIALLVLGETLLRNRLNGVKALLYWILPFLMAFIAMAATLLDFYCVRKKLRDTQMQIMEESFSNMGQGKSPRQKSKS